jgi:periplasmic protein TonB
MFDTALIESAHPVRDGRRARSLPVAIGLHAAVLAALVLSALLSTGEAPEPQISIIFPAFFGGPPPPQGNEAPPALPRNTRPNAGAVRRDPQTVRIPDEIPAVVHDATPAHDSVGEEDIRDAGGDGDGSPGSPFGAPGGTGDASTLPGTGGGEEILIPGVNGVLPPVLIRRVEPEYPELARKLHQEGVVILRAVITVSGAVDDVQVVKSAGPLLDASALAAVRRWVYKPATRDKRAVTVYLDVTVSFFLRG